MMKSNQKTKIKEHLSNLPKKSEPRKKLEPGAVVSHDINKAPRVNEWRNMHPEVLVEKCIGCGTCVGACPEATIILESVQVEPGKNKNIAQIDLNWCKGCGVCAAVCPVKAIIMKKER